MKGFLKVTVALFMVLVATMALSAQSNYPTKAIQVIVPAGPGGDTD